MADLKDAAARGVEVDVLIPGEEIDLTRWRNRSLPQRAFEAAIEPVRRWL